MGSNERANQPLLFVTTRKVSPRSAEFHPRDFFIRTFPAIVKQTGASVSTFDAPQPKTKGTGTVLVKTATDWFTSTEGGQELHYHRAWCSNRNVSRIPNATNARVGQGPFKRRVSVAVELQFRETNWKVSCLGLLPPSNERGFTLDVSYAHMPLR